jgi:hypothetical protein
VCEHGVCAALFGASTTWGLLEIITITITIIIITIIITIITIIITIIIIIIMSDDVRGQQRDTPRSPPSSGCLALSPSPHSF